MTVVPPTLETERLILRGTWGERDFAPLADFYANDAGAKFVGGPMVGYDVWRALAARIGHWQLCGFGLFALEEKATGAWAGWCGLWKPHGWPEIELGYALASPARGKGLITEAARAVQGHARDAHRLTTLVSYIVAENTPSQNVAQRLEGRRDGLVQIRDITAEVWRYPMAAESASRLGI